jgi:hypothetical protein
VVWLFGYAPYGPRMMMTGPALLSLLANGVAVAGVVLSRHSPRHAMVLVLVPYLSSVLTGYVAFGWWLAAMSILAVACLDGRRRHAVEAAAIAVTVIGVLVLGGIHFLVFDLDIVIFRDDPVYVAITCGMYLAAIALVILAFSLAGRAVRRGSSAVTEGSQASQASEVSEVSKHPGQPTLRRVRRTLSWSPGSTRSRHASERCSSRSAAD